MNTRYKFVGLGILCVFFFSTSIIAQSTFNYTPGAGVQWKSEDDLARFRILGYIQATQNFNSHYDDANPSNAFFVRRARLDFDFDYMDKYQIFFELDARGSRTEMVLAQLDIKYSGPHTVTVGKYITPFSPADYRTSRGLSTIERYSALNSLFLLPTIDTQYGIMLFAKTETYEYYLSVSNGNGAASQNIRENNSAKDFQARYVYNFTSEFKLGASFNYAIERSQNLRLLDHQFNSFNSLAITGKRYGFLGDFEYNRGPFLFRGEAFQFKFDEPISAQNQAEGFFGSYTELGYFLNGNVTDGFQLIGRYENASYLNSTVSGPDVLHSFLLGHNWYANGIFRLQTNIIYELANENSTLADVRLSGEKDAVLVMSMLQLKF